MLRPNDQKVHYKMYKQGKFWVLAGITAFTWQVGQVTAHAAMKTATTKPVVAKSTITTPSTKTAVLRSPISTNISDEPVAPKSATPAPAPTNDRHSDNSNTNPDIDHGTDKRSETKPDTSYNGKPNTVGKPTDNLNGADNSVEKATPEPSSAEPQGNIQPDNSNVGKQPNDANSSAGKGTLGPSSATSQGSAQPDNSTVGKQPADNISKPAKHYDDYDAKTNKANGVFGTSEWWIDQANILHIGEGTLADTKNWEDFDPDDLESGGSLVSEHPWDSDINDISQLKFEGNVIASKDSSGLFSNLISLTNIENIDQLDTSHIQNMANMFNLDSMLPVLDISHFNTANVTNMFGTFGNLSQLYDLDVSHLNTSQVTDMFGLFAGNSYLSHLDLSNFDTHQVTNMASMFEGNTNLIDLNLSSFDTSHVTSMARMFAGLEKIRNLDLAHFDTSQVVDITEMFQGVGQGTGQEISYEDDSDANNQGRATHVVVTDVPTSDHAIDFNIANLDLTKVAFLNNFLNTTPKTLTLGPKSVLTVTLIRQPREDHNIHIPVNQTAGLTTVSRDNHTFTGKWINVKTGQVYTAAELMSLYPEKGGGPAATYRPQTNLEVRDSTIALGSPWQPQDNFASANDIDGSALEFGQYPGLTVNPIDPDTHVKLDANTPGKYKVVYYLLDSDGDKVAHRQAQVIVTGLTLNEASKRLITTAPWEPLSNVKLAVDANGNTVTSTGVTATIVDKNGHTVTNFRVPGTYTVRYQLKDDAQSLVTMPLTVYSLANIKGQDSAIKLGSAWQPQDNFSAVDENGQALTPTSTGVHLTTAPNTKIPGNYGVTYTYTDAAHNVSQKTALVTVAGILLKQPQLQLVTTANWQPQSNLLVAVDATGKQLTINDLQVVVTTKQRQAGTATLTKPGTYLVTYQFSDKLGQHQAQTVVTVTSKATLKAKDQTLQVGDHWQAEAGFISATDEQGQALPWSAIKVTGQVNTNQAGQYPVTYTYTDAAGNLTSQVTTVTVLAATTGGGDNGNGGNSNGGGDNGGQPSNPGDNSNNGSQPAPAQPKPQPTPTETVPAGTTDAGTGEAGLTTSNTTPQPATVTVASAPAHLQPVLPTHPAPLAALPQTDETQSIGLSIMGIVGLTLSSWLAVMALVKRREND